MESSNKSGHNHLVERMVRNEEIFCSLLFDQINQTLRVVDFRGGNFQGKHNYLERVLVAEGMRKIFTLIERDDMNGWQRVGYQREGSIPGYYKRSDAYIMSRIYDSDYSADSDLGEEDPDNKEFLNDLKAKGKTLAGQKTPNIRIDQVTEVEVDSLVKDELDRRKSKGSGEKKAKASAKKKALPFLSTDLSNGPPVFPQFSREVEFFNFVVRNRRTKQFNVVGAEYQDCFGNAKVQLIFTPETKAEQNLARAGLEASIERLVELGAVSIFALARVDDPVTNAIYVATGFRNTGWMSRQLQTENGPVDQISLDKEAHLMADAAGELVSIFSTLLQEIPNSWRLRQRVVRQLLGSDSLERVVPTKMLSEGLGHLLEEKDRPTSPVVVFIDWAGGGDGARAAASIMPVLGERWPGASFVHVSFATPSQGLGTLVRSVLVHAGAENSVNAHVVAYNRPSLGVRFAPEDLRRIADLSDLTIVYAPAGAASLHDHSRKEAPRMLEISHLGILSFTDPESLVGDLAALGDFVDGEKTVEALRFWVQIGREGSFEDFGTVVLGPEGDAEERLWSLIDNARRRCFRVLVQPMDQGVPLGDPLVCPSRAAIELDVASCAVIHRVVPAGSRLITAIRGRQTLL